MDPKQLRGEDRRKGNPTNWNSIHIAGFVLAVVHCEA
jgi:hypothetical protein